MDQYNNQMGQGQGQGQPSVHPAYNAAYGIPTPQQPYQGTPTQPYQPSSQQVPGTQPGSQAQGYQTAAAQPSHTAQAAPAQTAQHAAPAQAASTAKKSSGGKTFLLAFAGALVACVLVFGVASATGFIGSKGTTLGAATSTSVEAVEEESSLAEAVASKCLPSVASITVYSSQTASSSMYDYLFGFGYGYNNTDDGSLVQSGMGSGVVLSEDGYIITNYHVVDGGSKYEVTIEGDTYEAELVGEDSSSDVAVLKVNDSVKLTPIEIGDSDNITIGEWVMSIGSPFGLEQSVATGIVSATSRSQIMDSTNSSSSDVTIYPNMIQTDAAINPGNSGGALVDSKGQLIGINTLITSYSGNYSGVGFAIPVNYAINIAQDVIEGRNPTHAQLGVSLTTVNKAIAQRYGFAVDEGAYVSAVSAGSGAANAGIQVGDIIVGFDGQEVSGASDLMLDVRTKNPGDEVTLTINRNGNESEVKVTLGSGATESSSSSSAQSQGSGRSNSGNGMFGQQR